MDFFVIDAEGNLVSTGSCQPDNVAAQGGAGLTVMAGTARFGQYYDLVSKSLENYDDATIALMRTNLGPGFRWSCGRWVDERSLAMSKTQKWREIKTARDAAEFGTFMVGVYEFDCDQRSQARLMTAMQAATDARSLGEPFSIDWTLTDGSVVTLTRAQVIAAGRALQEHVNAQHHRARLLKAEIDAAISKAAVVAVTW